MQIPNISEAFIVHAKDKNLRYRGSSGGAISALVKFLFETKAIDTCVSLKRNNIFFEPEIINSFAEYISVGSVYHEVDLVEFARKNINSFKSSTLIICTPCQVVPIKNLFENKNKKVFVISFVCSAQMKKEASLFLFDYLHIGKEEIKSFQYRGNGWPSGIEIKTASQVIKVPNLFSIWTDIFHSGIFTLDKCFCCDNTFSETADIIVADPWLERYIKTDKIGNSVVIAKTQTGIRFFQDAINHNYIIINEIASGAEIINSQVTTLRKKYVYIKYRKFIFAILRITRSKVYIGFIFKRFHAAHTKFFTRFINYLYNLEKK